MHSTLYSRKSNHQYQGIFAALATRLQSYLYWDDNKHERLVYKLKTFRENLSEEMWNCVRPVVMIFLRLVIFKIKTIHD